MRLTYSTLLFRQQQCFLHCISDSLWDSRTVSLNHKVKLVLVIQLKLFLLFQNFELCEVFKLNFPKLVIHFHY